MYAVRCNCYAILRTCYAMSGTDVAYMPYCVAMRCPVLTYCMPLQDWKAAFGVRVGGRKVASPIVLRVCYGMSGTDVGYAAPRICGTDEEYGGTRVCSTDVCSTDVLRHTDEACAGTRGQVRECLDTTLDYTYHDSIEVDERLVPLPFWPTNAVQYHCPSPTHALQYHFAIGIRGPYAMSGADVACGGTGV
eukprot:2847266-Rhodomonas_salina.1